MQNGISVTLHTTVDVIQSNFAFQVGVDLHLYRVHFLVFFSCSECRICFGFQAVKWFISILETLSAITEVYSLTS